MTAKSDRIEHRSAFDWLGYAASMNPINRVAPMKNQFSALLTGFLRLIDRAVFNFFFPKLSIVVDQEDFLAIDTNGCTLVASKHEQVVTLNGQRIATFKNVEAIHIQHFVRGAGRRQKEWWKLSLKTAQQPAVCLGKTRDWAQVSLAAARLGTLIERPVVEVSPTGLRSSRVNA